MRECEICGGILGCANCAPNKKNGNKSALVTGVVGLCGCGKPVRYMIRGTEGSCNKYMRCLTREELEETLAEANKIIYQLRKALENIAEYEGATATGAQAEKALREAAA